MSGSFAGIIFVFILLIQVLVFDVETLCDVYFCLSYQVLMYLLTALLVRL